ncbi:MAG: hypothetical protein J2P37_31100, partial [Ktedonobacteraceae bacterium]|nr:hypothetical protein [Ktedonobacteraceae bacterium]
VIALCLGAGVVLLLNFFDRGGWFALLSGLFGALLYAAVVFPKLLFGLRAGPRAARHDQPGRWEERAARRQAIFSASVGVVIAIVVGSAALVALFFLPAHRPLFAFLSAILGLVFCISLFAAGALVVVLFMACRERLGAIRVRFNADDDVHDANTDEGRDEPA